VRRAKYLELLDPDGLLVELNPRLEEIAMELDETSQRLDSMIE
jgi:hypothetical protein